MKKICLFSGSRSDFDRLLPVYKALKECEECEPYLVVGGSHLSSALGDSIRLVEQQGIPIYAQVDMLLSSGTTTGNAISVGVGTIGLASVLESLSPDLVIVLGDRFELLSVMTVTLCLNLPLAHIGGGQRTLGANDEQIRHVLSKASHLHFVANSEFAGNLQRMGEEEWRINVTGSPSIDYLVQTPHLSKQQLGERFGLDLNRLTALVAYHPTTRLSDKQEEMDKQFFDALRDLDLQLILTYPNADHGHRGIVNALENLAQIHNQPCIVRKNLGRELVVNAMRHCDLIIGNSSLGVIEASFTGIPAVNVGPRQDGRPRTKNVIDTGITKRDILDAVQRALQKGRVSVTCPYGDGNAATKISQSVMQILKKRTREELLSKNL